MDCFMANVSIKKRRKLLRIRSVEIPNNTKV